MSEMRVLRKGCTERKLGRGVNRYYTMARSAIICCLCQDADMLQAVNTGEYVLVFQVRMGAHEASVSMGAEESFPSPLLLFYFPISKHLRNSQGCIVPAKPIPSPPISTNVAHRTIHLGVQVVDRFDGYTTE